MIAALEWAVTQRDERWGMDREISATNTEVLHSFLLAFLASKGVKNLGKPIHFDRPWEAERKKQQMLSFKSFRSMLGGANG